MLEGVRTHLLFVFIWLELPIFEDTAVSMSCPWGMFLSRDENGKASSWVPGGSHVVSLLGRGRGGGAVSSVALKLYQGLFSPLPSLLS